MLISDSFSSYPAQLSISKALSRVPLKLSSLGPLLCLLAQSPTTYKAISCFSLLLLISAKCCWRKMCDCWWHHYTCVISSFKWPLGTTWWPSYPFPPGAISNPHFAPFPNRWLGYSPLVPTRFLKRRRFLFKQGQCLRPWTLKPHCLVQNSGSPLSWPCVLEKVIQLLCVSSVSSSVRWEF